MIVYLFENKLNGKKYVGQSIRSIGRRVGQHRRDARRGCPFPLHSAIRKYGPDGFFISVIEELDNQAATDAAEVYWIQRHNSQVPSGYNVLPGGRGGAMPDETRVKISNSLKGHKRSDETRQRMSQAKKGSTSWCKGLKMPPSFGAKISASLIGRKLSEATRQNMSKAKTGIPLPPSVRKAISDSTKGRPMPSHTIEAARVANTGAKRSEACRQRMRDAWALRKLRSSLLNEQAPS